MEAEYEFEAAVPEEAKVLLAERLQMRGAPFFPLPPVEGEKRLVHSDIDTPSLINRLPHQPVDQWNLPLQHLLLLIHTMIIW